LIGALIMAHSDDNGLVLPPRMAAHQLVIVPIWKSDEEKKRVMNLAQNIHKELNTKYQVIFDEREQYKPGFKFSEWELQGIPLRIEIGPKDEQQRQVVLVRRDSREKIYVAIDDLRNKIEDQLVRMQQEMFQKALDYREQNTHEVDNYLEFKKKIESPGGFFKVLWCGSPQCEEKIAEETKASIRLIPFSQKNLDGKCLLCDASAQNEVILAKAY
jgi:prolyl-tRNA synthetase